MKWLLRRCFSAIWFGCAAYIAAVIPIALFSQFEGINILFNSLTAPAFSLGILAGFFLGYRILLMSKSTQSLNQVLLVGALVPLAILLLIIHIMFGFIILQTIHGCIGSTLASCQHPLQGIIYSYLAALAVGLLLYGWFPVVIGMISAWLLYKFS